MLYNLGKTNIVVDALSRLSIGSVAHVEDDKKEFVHEFYHLDGLGVGLVDLAKCSTWVQNGL